MTTYHVWRRSDGYVSATVYPPINGRDTFDVLLIADDWPTARQRIEDERDEKHHALVASWDREPSTKEKS